MSQNISRGALRGLGGALTHLKTLGFQPATVLDVGAAFGTEPLYQAFPTAKHLLFEPLAEFQSQIKACCRTYPDMHWIQKAVSHVSGTAMIQIHPSLFGSSLLCLSHPHVGIQTRTVELTTLDEAIKTHTAKGPYLLKVDVQGAEIDVLKGAEQVLVESEVVILEASLFSFYKEQPLLNDVLNFMQPRGFTLYEVIDFINRPLDEAMGQLDIAFVKTDGRFRYSQAFAHDTQMPQLIKRLQYAYTQSIQRAEC